MANSNAIMFRMDLKTYIEVTNASKSAMARDLTVSYDQLNQWCTGRRPIPVKHCTAIESLTKGYVSRKDMRPDDWQAIWPDLAAKEPA